MRVKFAAITTAPTALYVLLQNQDPVAADWYPNPAVAAAPAFLTALGAKDPNNPVICGGQVTLPASPAITDRYSVPFTGCPGVNFRLGVVAVGAAGAFTLTVQADMQKWLADAT
jgi:hypothetical protein